MLYRAFILCSFAMVAACSSWMDSNMARAVEKEDSKVYPREPVVAKAKTIGAEDKEPTQAPSPAGKKLLAGPAPQWIWGSQQPAGEDRFVFRKQFEAAGNSAELIATCDNRMTVWLNGASVAQSTSWEVPVQADVSKQLREGENEMVVLAHNHGSAAGFVLKLAVTSEEGKTQYVVTDDSWQAARKKDAEKWSEVAVLGKMGVGPWGDVFREPKVQGLARSDRNVFHVPPGFQVEELFTVPKDKLGSWVSIAFDEKGRLIASDQGGKGLCRVTPPPIGSEEPTRVEHLDVKITSAQGLLAAFGSLYVSVNGGPGSGLYRVRDTDGDDQYDQVEKLKALRGGGEHGPHALRLSPDGKSILVIAGNHTDLPKFDASRVPPVWGEDLLLPRQWDARGHARGKLAPGGWICKTDPEGKSWEVRSIGYRNPYDMDFNADGELFAYDADMEWDMGTSWYRPTRLCHATSGSEFGWRSGTGKWPTYYADSLPPVVDIGPGSPVGVTFGYGTKFPAKYQKALYLLDWTFGTIYAIHLKPDGASYSGVREEFVSRTPLPLTDAAVGPDGALYFTIGGRGTQSALFRVTYVGDESTEPADAGNEEGAESRSVRRRLEALHGKHNADPAKLDFIWEHLGREDRFIRFAARTALEFIDTSKWSSRALAEEDPQTLITAVVALARQGEKPLEPQVLAALGRLDVGKLDHMQQLELLRAYALTFIRMGAPNQATAMKIAQKLDPYYPAESDALNRELSRVLVYLNSPTVITKTLKLMKEAPEPSPQAMSELLARNPGYGGTIAKMLANYPALQKVHYALVLRNMRYGWTLEQRREYFRMLDELQQRSGGASYKGFIGNIRKEAIENLSPAEKKALAAETLSPPPKATELPKPKGPGQKWTLEDLLALTEDGLARRSFEGGKRAYAASRCIVCHRFGGEGGATGPDLTNLAGRFSYKDLAESLVHPSKVISDQYRATQILTSGGKVITGRVVNDDGKKLTVMADPEDATKIVEIPKSEIEEQQPSKVSLMPKDLLNPLGKEEVLDLLAYLLSRGNPRDRMFAAAGKASSAGGE